MAKRITVAVVVTRNIVPAKIAMIARPLTLHGVCDIVAAQTRATDDAKNNMAKIALPNIFIRVNIFRSFQSGNLSYNYIII